MTLFIARQYVDQLLRWATECHPRECCGLLIGNEGRVHQIILSENFAQAPEKQFEIDPSLLIKWEKLGRTEKSHIIGYFHSHPNGICEPSRNDAQQAQLDGRVWVIVTQNDVAAWRAVEHGDLYQSFTRIKLGIYAG